MGFDDICSRGGLDLGLGFASGAAGTSAPKMTPAGLIKLNDHELTKDHEPCLTLSLSGDHHHQTYNYDDNKVDNWKADAGIYNHKACTTPTTAGAAAADHHHHHHHHHHQYSNNDLCRQDSAASSFSNVSVKRERDVGSEDVDTTADERVFSRVSDEDEDGPNARKKLRLTKAQSAFLEESFKQHSTLNPKQKQELARELNLRPRQVEVWFQNRRARTKLKQTEVDCEYLKKCCESLTDENRRLQKELQELKALKMRQPFYMQLPAATLTMCPACCQRMGGALAADNSSNKPFNIAPKPHLFNPFTNPSAAC